jgi:16S rRNA A1518/A1519 N6-dimethyltransferase RsmA/KsgA/DIM1 with predicted DNA glycosylase/AP lyase activity
MPTIAERLDEYEIYPKERLGQHILTDEHVLSFIAQQISPGSNVIEIGAGPGNLTEALAKTAKRVVGIEIDQQYHEILEDLENRINNSQTDNSEDSQMVYNPFFDTFGTKTNSGDKKVTIIFGDAIKSNYDKIMGIDRDGTWEIAANIPYHISEPFLRVLTTLPIQSAILMVGDNFGRTIQTDNPKSDWYTKTSFIANAFFSIENILELPETAFYPRPSTRSYLMRLTPFGGEDINPWNTIFRQLFRNERTKPVRSVLETAFAGSGESDTHRSKKERNRYDRRETNRELARIAKFGKYSQDETIQSHRGPRIMFSDIGKLLNLPNSILDSQFGSLNNENFRTLAASIRNYFPR